MKSRQFRSKRVVRLTATVPSDSTDTSLYTDTDTRTETHHTGHVTTQLHNTADLYQYKQENSTVMYHPYDHDH